MRAEEFIGLSKKRAQDRAEENNLIFRVVSSDGEVFLGPPPDARDDRVCCELVKGVVAKAYVG